MEIATKVDKYDQHDVQEGIMVSSNNIINLQPIIKNKNNDVPPYNQFSCGEGCRDRVIICPFLVLFLLSCAPCLVCEMCYERKCSCPTFCMCDYLLVLNYCPCFNPNAPAFMGKSELKPVIHSFVTSSTLDLDDMPGIDDKIESLQYAASYFADKDTKIVRVVCSGPIDNDSTFTATINLIKSLPNVHTLILPTTSRFLSIVEYIINRLPPPKMNKVKLRDSPWSVMFSEDMFQIILKEGKYISYRDFESACRHLESATYPIYISLKGTNIASNLSALQAIKILGQKNPKVKIFTSTKQFISCYIDLSLPLPIIMDSSEKIPKALTEVAQIPEMTRETKNKHVDTGIDIDEHGLWATRINQCMGFYIMHGNSGAVSKEAIIGMFQGYSFEEIANMMMTKYPDSALPKGWKNDIDNKKNIGYVPSDVLSQITNE